MSLESQSNTNNYEAGEVEGTKASQELQDAYVNDVDLTNLIKDLRTATDELDTLREEGKGSKLDAQKAARYLELKTRAATLDVLMEEQKRKIRLALISKNGAKYDVTGGDLWQNAQ